MVAHKFVQMILYDSIALPHAIQKIKHSALALDANIAICFAPCYISHLGLVLYFSYSIGGSALTITYPTEAIHQRHKVCCIVVIAV